MWLVMRKVRQAASGGEGACPALSRSLMLLGIIFLVALLGAWQDISGKTINPRFVERIKDGQTTKQEILLLFGDPQEVNRTPEGPIFTYRSYRDAPYIPSTKSAFDKEVPEQSSVPFYVDNEKKVKKVPTKTKGTILDSSLVIRFKPDGETVLSHEYQKH
jgi:outer membrane protein assembly factor BamE (lipoprotein component of BamABCDE complex)